MDFDALMEETPIEHFWYSRRLNRNRHSIHQKSNAIRYALMHKFGGIYLDTDVISLKPWPKDFKNFIVIESTAQLSSAIFHMDKHSPFLWECMVFMVSCLHMFKYEKVYAVRFIKLQANQNSAKIWGINGPVLMTKVTRQFLCTNTSSSEIATWNCPNVKILQPKYIKSNRLARN